MGNRGDLNVLSRWNFSPIGKLALPLPFRGQYGRCHGETEVSSILPFLRLVRRLGPRIDEPAVRSAHDRSIRRHLRRNRRLSAALPTGQRPGFLLVFLLHRNGLLARLPDPWLLAFGPSPRPARINGASGGNCGCRPLGWFWSRLFAYPLLQASSRQNISKWIFAPFFSQYPKVALG
jgi:hypothetical protein